MSSASSLQEGRPQRAYASEHECPQGVTVFPWGVSRSGAGLSKSIFYWYLVTLDLNEKNGAAGALRRGDGSGHGLPNTTTTREGKTMNFLKKLWKEEEGQDLTEYALLLVLVALAAIGSLGTLATAINKTFSNAAQNLT